MKKMGAFLTCFGLCVCLTPVNVFANDSYTAYEKVVNKLEKKYGSASLGQLDQNSYSYDCVTGVAYANLVDMDADGLDELIVYYKNGSNQAHKAYTYEVYTIKGKKAVKIGSGDGVTGIQSVYSNVTVATVDGQSYLVVDEDNEEIFYTVTKGKLEKAISFGLGIASDGGYVNGELVSSDEMREMSTKWYVDGDFSVYSLTASEASELNKTIGFTSSTIATIKGEEVASFSSTMEDGFYQTTLIKDASGITSIKLDGNTLDIEGSFVYTQGKFFADPSEHKSYSFVLTDTTEYQEVGGGSEPRNISKEQFKSSYVSHPDSGLDLNIQVENGVVKKISIGS